eukprot:TRINITY_DN6470_c0_g1_i1.p1 TRINITY_DN6470_c0_g1~~TRINITY_DN6470_c0_g1_i1.p1  ORF type:complete len:275 (-),score=-8.47 TRINITY_DN6470_c0_g1_i1:201-1025(-)
MACQAMTTLRAAVPGVAAAATTRGQRRASPVASFTTSTSSPLSAVNNISPSSVVLSKECSHRRETLSQSSRAASVVRAMAADGEASSAPSGRIIRGKVFVLEDNIDTDQIIPAEYLTLVPSNPEEYEKLGSYALAGLPAKHELRYVQKGEMKTEYPIIIGGANFGCGSSREHAPVALGAAGCRAVVAESYARIFFRNCVATGELYPVECADGLRLCDVIKSGDEVTVDLEHDLLIHHGNGKQYQLKPIGEAGPVIDAGGIFNFARQSGMIASKA